MDAKNNHPSSELSGETFKIPNLGECRYPSPLRFASQGHHLSPAFVSDETRVRWKARVGPGDQVLFEEAGPREKIFFSPPSTTAAIVTCGGLSPGLNNVIRSVYLELTRNYGVDRVLGILNGYLGLNPASNLPPQPLSWKQLAPIDKLGGTILGSSRGPQDPVMMADFLVQHNIQILFCLGGDGTLRGAHQLSQEIQRRGLPIAIVGIPKTIDNDIPFVRLSFGYATALEKAAEVISSAHVEARGALNGIGLVKLMGRNSGMIAAGATVVAQEVNFTLIPEIPFPMDGPDGLLAALEAHLQKRGHAVIVAAEGAGQHLFEASSNRDPSGNVKFHDIGTYLKSRIETHFKGGGPSGFPITLKYLDPSYLVRSVPADSYDRMLCDQMARNAVHAAMTGKTGMFVGLENEHFIHVPIPAILSEQKRLDLSGELWRSVLQITGQPRW